MKLIKFKDFGGQLNTRFLLLAALGDASQGGGIDYSELTRRCRVIDVLEKLPEDAKSVHLEDADYETTKRVISTFKWTVASVKLKEIIEDVMTAKESPSVALVAGE